MKYNRKAAKSGTGSIPGKGSSPKRSAASQLANNTSLSADQLGKWHAALAAKYNIATSALGYAVVVSGTIEGRVTRRLFLSLHAATRAVLRARERGCTDIDLIAVELRRLDGAL